MISEAEAIDRNKTSIDDGFHVMSSFTSSTLSSQSSPRPISTSSSAASFSSTLPVDNIDEFIEPNQIKSGKNMNQSEVPINELIKPASQLKPNDFTSVRVAVRLVVLNSFIQQ